MAFDPYRLTTQYSLNRVVIMEVPRIELDDAIRGQKAYQLISAQAIDKLIRQNFGRLSIHPSELFSNQLLAGYLNKNLYSGKEAAIEIAQLLGRRLGILLAVLKTGHPANRKARPEWDSDVWDYWAQIKRAYIGGGLSMNPLGEQLVQSARGLMAEAGYPDFEIHQATEPQYLPLYGMARYAPKDSKRAYLYDYGSTFLKKGWATFDKNEVVELNAGEHPSAVQRYIRWEGDELERANLAADEIVNQIINDSKDRRWYGDGTLAIMISLACYVHDGQPLEQGGYGILRHVVARDSMKSLQDWIAWQLHSRLDRAIEVRVLHDGTAAAMAYSGQPNTAVLTLGTAIGFGFPPIDGEFRKFSEKLHIQT